MGARGTSTRSRLGWQRLLLALPFVAVLSVPVYAREEPKLAGVPFFYWYLFAWVALTIGIMALAYLVRRGQASP